MKSLSDIEKKLKSFFNQAGNFATQPLSSTAKTINTVANTKFLPGQKKTVAQVLKKPENLFLPSALSNVPRSNPLSVLSRPVGQATRGLLDSNTVGLVRTPGANPETTSEKIGYGVGYGAGFVNPYNLAGKAFGTLGKLGQGGAGLVGKTIVPKAISKVTPHAVKTIGKILGEEVAQTAGYVGAKRSLGQKQDFGDDLKAGLLMHGAFSGVGRAGRVLIGQAAQNFDTKSLADRLGEQGKLSKEEADILYADPGIKRAYDNFLEKSPGLRKMLDKTKADPRAFLTLIASSMDKQTREVVGDLNRADAASAGIKNYISKKPNVANAGLYDTARYDDLLNSKIKIQQQLKKTPDTYDNTSKIMRLKSSLTEIETGMANIRNNPPVAQPPLSDTPIGLENMDRSKLGTGKIPGASSFVGDNQATVKANLDIPVTKGYAQTKAIMQEDTGQSDFKKLFSEWIGKRDAAKTRALVSGSKFKNIPEDKGFEVIRAIETPEKAVSGEARGYAGEIKKEFDSLYADAKNAGMDINYLQNYITHIWKESPQDAKKAYEAFKSTHPGFKFAKDRTIPTYEEGIAMGLTPKYSRPSQIVAEYTRRLEQAKANLLFFKGLKQRGLVVGASDGAKNPDFAPIQAVGFPTARNMGEKGQEIISNYYAPRSIADTINKVFNPDEGNKMLSKVADVAGGLQDITLSGGIPGTPLNAFSFAQLQKEVLSGRPAAGIKSFVRSLSPGATRQYFENNAQQIIKMQERNISINTNFDTNSLGKDPAIKRTLGEKFGNLWTSTVNAPTFKRFLPTLEVEMFNNVEKSALSAGKAAPEAADIAAQAVKNFYGLTDTASLATRSPNAKNLASALLFAPRYRESMVNFWVKNIKALKNPLARENRANVTFLLGAAATFAGMNEINQQLNGHPMWENGEGKEDKLLIPTGDGSVIGVPFLSSIATIPRALFREGVQIAKGDVNAAAKDALQSYSSILIKPVADVLTNQDYFGKEIASETDLPEEKLKKQAEYLFRQYGLAHPYIKEATDPTKQDDPAYQRISRATELPFRFYTEDGINKSKFYDKYYELKPFAEKYKDMQWKNPAEADAFLAKNKEKLDQFEYMKQLQNVYYDQGAKDTSLLGGFETPTDTIQNGNRLTYQDQTGEWKDLDITTPIQKPTLSGNKELDKKLVSKYNSALTTRANDITTAFQDGKIDAVSAEKMLTDLLDQKVSTAKAKKPKQISVKKISMGRVRFGSFKKTSVKNIGPKNLVSVVKIKAPMRTKTQKIGTPKQSFSYKVTRPQLRGLTIGRRIA